MNFELTEDQLAIRDMARDLAQKEIAPHAAEWDEQQHFPREVFTEAGRTRTARSGDPRRVRRCRSRLCGLRDHPRRNRRCRRWGRARRCGAQLAVHEPPLSLWLRRTGRSVLPETRKGRVDRRVGSDRSRRGVRCRRHQDDCSTRRRRMGAQRIQELHHPRHRRRRRGGDRTNLKGRRPPRDLRLLRAVRPARGRTREEGEQARDALLRHLFPDL